MLFALFAMSSMYVGIAIAIASIIIVNIITVAFIIFLFIILVLLVYKFICCVFVDKI